MLFDAYYAGTYTVAKPDHSILWLGWSMPGPGRWWLEDDAFFMQRSLHPWPFKLAFRTLTGVEQSKGLGIMGRLTGPYIRLYWRSSNTPVFSSFALNTQKGADTAPFTQIQKALKR